MQKGANAVIYLGNVQVTSLSVNGVELSAEEYDIQNRVLTIYSAALTEEYNTVEINDETVTVTVVEIGTITYGAEEPETNLGLIIGLSVGGAVLVAGAVVAFILIRRKKVGTND